MAERRTEMKTHVRFTLIAAAWIGLLACGGSSSDGNSCSGGASGGVAAHPEGCSAGWKGGVAATTAAASLTSTPAARAACAWSSIAVRKSRHVLPKRRAPSARRVERAPTTRPPATSMLALRIPAGPTAARPTSSAPGPTAARCPVRRAPSGSPSRSPRAVSACRRAAAARTTPVRATRTVGLSRLA